MPLLPGKKNIGKNIETEEAHGKPRKQAVAIALSKAGVAKGKDARRATQGDARQFVYQAIETLQRDLGRKPTQREVEREVEGLMPDAGAAVGVNAEDLWEAALKVIPSMLSRAIDALPLPVAEDAVTEVKGRGRGSNELRYTAFDASSSYERRQDAELAARKLAAHQSSGEAYYWYDVRTSRWLVDAGMPVNVANKLFKITARINVKDAAPYALGEKVLYGNRPCKVVDLPANPAAKIGLQTSDGFRVSVDPSKITKMPLIEDALPAQAKDVGSYESKKTFVDDYKGWRIYRCLDPFGRGRVEYMATKGGQRDMYAPEGFSGNLRTMRAQIDRHELAKDALPAPIPVAAPAKKKPTFQSLVFKSPEEAAEAYRPHTAKELGKAFGKDAAPKWQPDSQDHDLLDRLHQTAVGQGYKLVYSGSTGKPGELTHVYGKGAGLKSREGERAIIVERKNGKHGIGYRSAAKTSDALPAHIAMDDRDVDQGIIETLERHIMELQQKLQSGRGTPGDQGIWAAQLDNNRRRLASAKRGGKVGDALSFKEYGSPCSVCHQMCPAARLSNGDVRVRCDRHGDHDVSGGKLYKTNPMTGKISVVNDTMLPEAV